MKMHKQSATLSHQLYAKEGSNQKLIGWRYVWNNDETTDLAIALTNSLDTLIEPATLLTGG